MNRTSFIFSTCEGHELCQHIIREQLGYSPHDYQLEGVCKALDGIDLLAITPTGSGKTGYLVMYLTVMRAVMRNPRLCENPPKNFRKNPTIVVVCPTLALEDDMEKKFMAASMTTLVINKDTTLKALIAQPPVNIWELAGAVEVLLLSPEQLASPKFEELLKDKAYQARVVALGVDEAHLLNSWGQSFRRDFEQIGVMRARFTNHPLLIALTATLRSGPWFRSVCHFLGLHDGQYYLLRRSNMRYDISFLFRTVQSGARSYLFPELDWVLEGDRQIIVFCPTIALGFRVATYLHARSEGLAGVDKRIRMYNSLNWASYNAETLSLMRKDSRSRVTVATDSLAVGIDVPGTDDIVLYDTTLPPDTDTILQKAGRIRDGHERNSRVVIYLPKNAEILAKAALEGRAETRKMSSKGRAGQGVDHGVAQVVLASCKVDILNELYDNPLIDTPCRCPMCVAKPPLQRPTPCSCSSCSPDTALSTTVTPTETHSASPTQAKPPKIPAEQKLTRAMKDVAHERLMRFRNRLRHNCDERLEDLYPPKEFLPNELIDTLLNNLYKISDLPSLQQTITVPPVLQSHLSTLLTVLDELCGLFDVMRKEAKAAKAAREKARRDEKRAERLERMAEQSGVEPAKGSSEMGPEESEEGEEESTDESEPSSAGEEGEEDGGVERLRLMIRIPGGRFQRN